MIAQTGRARQAGRVGQWAPPRELGSYGSSRLAVLAIRLGNADAIREDSATIAAEHPRQALQATARETPQKLPPRSACSSPETTGAAPGPVSHGRGTSPIAAGKRSGRRAPGRD